MTKLILATDEQGDIYLEEARAWFYGANDNVNSTPSSLFTNGSALFTVAEFNANKDGLTLYTSRS